MYELLVGPDVWIAVVPDGLLIMAPHRQICLGANGSIVGLPDPNVSLDRLDDAALFEDSSRVRPSGVLRLDDDWTDDITWRIAVPHRIIRTWSGELIANAEAQARYVTMDSPWSPPEGSWVLPDMKRVIDGKPLLDSAIALCRSECVTIEVHPAHLLEVALITAGEVVREGPPTLVWERTPRSAHLAAPARVRPAPSDRRRRASIWWSSGADIGTLFTVKA